MTDPESIPVRVALYARVSTDEQREGQTIESQLTELERFAQQKGWAISGTYKDDGWSGSILARPELDRLRDDGTKDIFDAVIVNDVDRLARDVAHLGIIKQDLERKRIKLVFRKLPGESSPTYNLMVNILGSFAEFERELIIDRTRRGRRHKVEVRKQYVGCIAPYGYHYETKSATDGNPALLNVIPEEAQAIKQIYALALQGVSMEKIARRLNEMGIPPRKSKNGWNACTIHRIVRNEMYAGIWSYGKGESCQPQRRRNNNAYRRITKSSRRPKPRSQWLRIPLPENLTIIDSSVWSRVQTRVDSNPKFSPRNAKTDYLLQGLLRCGYCGGACAGTFSRAGGKTYPYYRCWRKQCKASRWTPAAVIEPAVWSTLESALRNPQQLEKRINDAQGEISKRSTLPPQDTSRELESRRGEEESRLFQRYRNQQLSAHQMATELERLRDRLQLEQAAPTLPKQKVDRSFPETCRAFATRLHDATPATKQAVIRQLVLEIKVWIDHIKIRAKVERQIENEGNGFPANGNETPSSATTPTSELSICEAALPLLRESKRNTTDIEFELTAQLPKTGDRERRGLKIAA